MQLLREAKELNVIEEHVRERIREELDKIEGTSEAKKEKKLAKVVKAQGDDTVKEKLSKEMPKSSDAPKEEADTGALEEDLIDGKA